MGRPGTNRMAARQPSSSKSAAPSTSPSPGGSSSPARTTASPVSTSGTMLTMTYCGCMSSARSRPPSRWTCARRGGGDRATEAQTRRHSGPDSDGDANARDSDGGLSLPSTRFSLGLRRRLLRATGGERQAVPSRRRGFSQQFCRVAAALYKETLQSRDARLTPQNF